LTPTPAGPPAGPLSVLPATAEPNATLPVTGSDVGRLLRLAIVLLVTGLGATFGTRRRRAAE
jgi:LPXTG-motif cell wall-anchored protein